MREKLLNYGYNSLSPHEQIEIFLYLFIPRKDTNPIAHRIVDEFGTWYNMLEYSAEEIAKIEGIGVSTAQKMLMFKEFASAYLSSQYVEKFVFKNDEEIKNCCQAAIASYNQEHLFLLGLDAKNALIKKRLVAKGTIDSVYVEPRQIIEMISGTKICKVVLAHNHPAGKAMPSDNDIEATDRIKKALKTIDIELVDHYIVANGKIASMRELGLLGYRY